MPKTSSGQKKTVGRVMHEFKHKELKSGPKGKGGKVKNPRQAIAIALSEAGASKYQSKSDKRKRFARTKRKEAHGQTAQQEKEGKSHVGARGMRESTRAMGGKNAKGMTARGKKVSRTRMRTSSAKTRSRIAKRALEHVTQE